MLFVKRSIRASSLGWKKLALTPALSPRRGRIIARWFETTNNHPGSLMNGFGIFIILQVAKQE